MKQVNVRVLICEYDLYFYMNQCSSEKPKKSDGFLRFSDRGGGEP